GADFTIYSFQAVKHITCGEGGALFFKDPEHADQARWLKRYGIHRPSLRLPDGDLNAKSDIRVAGFNYYSKNISAHLHLEPFQHVEGVSARYRDNGCFYEQNSRNIPGVTLARRHPESVSAYWTYTLLVERRSDLIRALKEAGISSQRLHVRNDVYSCFGGQ